MELSPVLHRGGQTPVKVKDVMPVHSFQISCNYSVMKSNASTSSVFCNVLEKQNFQIPTYLHSVRKIVKLFSPEIM